MNEQKKRLASIEDIFTKDSNKNFEMSKNINTDVTNPTQRNLHSGR
jgi:hypothetical protein